ncbi:MAG: TonB-dependent receptor [Myxococcota bacterium]|nr:TonB-dependent receptor [Myxococcota bacterium]
MRLKAEMILLANLNRIKYLALSIAFFFTCNVEAQSTADLSTAPEASEDKGPESSNDLEEKVEPETTPTSQPAASEGAASVQPQEENALPQADANTEQTIMPLDEAIPEGPETDQTNAVVGAALAWEDVDDEDMLDMELTDLLNIDIEVTSAAKVAITSREAPSIVTVISREVIQGRGYRSIGEALADVPGLYVVNDLVTYNVGVRGIYGGVDSWSRTIKVMIDGHPVTFYGTGGNLLGPEFIPINAVEAIEIIRGPGSALYGANAFLGVVNIRTRGGTSHPHLEAGGELGTFGQEVSGSGFAFSAFKLEGEQSFSLVAAVKRARSDRSGLAVPDTSPQAPAYQDEVSQGDISRPLSALIKGTWGTDTLGTLGVSLIHQKTDAHAEFSEIGVLTHGNRIAMTNTNHRLTYDNSFFNDAFQIRATAALSLAQTSPKQRLDAGDATFTFRRDRKNKAKEAGLELRYLFGEHSVILGADYLNDLDYGDTVYQVTRPEFTPQGSIGDQIGLVQGTTLELTNWGIYAQGLVRPLDDLAITAGLRYDINDLWDNALNGRGAIVYELIDDLHLKALYGTSYVPPAPTQLNAHPLKLGSVQGNPELASQMAQTAELEASYRFKNLAWLSLNGFWTQIEDRIEFVQAANFLEARNLTTSTTWGGEAALGWRWEWLRGQGNVSYHHTRIADPDPVPYWWQIVYNEDGAGGLNPPGFPTWMGHLSISVHLPQWWVEATISTHAATERKSSVANIRENTTSYTLPGYITLDAHVRTLDLRLIGDSLTEISAHLTNILNQRYAEAGARGVDIPSLGRTFFVRLTQELF